MPPDPGRGVKQSIRARIHARRRFKVEPQGGLVYRYTCTSCDTTFQKTLSTKPPMGRLILAECPVCTERERDRRMPLR